MQAAASDIISARARRRATEQRRDQRGDPPADSRSLELRAATSYADFLARQGRGTDGYAILAPLYGWFTEGLDTVDLRAAADVLARVEPGRVP